MEKPSLLRRLRRALWFATAAVLIVLAVLFSVTRLLLPGLDDYRAEVESRVSALLGQPLRMRTLHARLHGMTPQVVLEDVALLDASGSTAVAQFREVRLGLDLFASLRRQRLVLAELAVVGAELTVVRRTDGSLRLQGLVDDGSDSDSTELAQLLLEQGRLALLESRLHWRDLSSGRNFDLERVAIELRNQGTRHQLNVDALLPPALGRSVHLALDLRGDVLQLTAWNGRVYVEGQSLLPAQWPAEWRALTGVGMQRGSVDLRAWGAWQDGSLQQVQGSAEVSQLALQAAGGTLRLHRLATTARWQRQEAGWELTLDEVQLQPRANSVVQSLQAQVRHDAGAWQIQATALRLEDAALLAPVLPQLDAEQRAMVSAMRPEGRVRDLRIEYSSSGEWHVQGRLDRAALRPWGKLPGFRNLSGQWVWHGDHGQIMLDSRDGSVALPYLFREALAVQRLQGAIVVQHSNDDWRIELDAMQVATPDIHAMVDAVLTLPQADLPYLDLRGRFWDGRAVNAPRYLPAGIMGAEALTWLDQAFRAGHVTSGSALFHGPLAAFPFDGNEGRFEADFDARDAELFLHQDWPGLSQVDARVRFLNRSLLIEAERGMMYNSHIQRARVAIDDLHHPLLAVQGAGRLRGADGIALLRDTPLRQHLGDFITGLRLEGESDIELEFELPLDSAAALAQPFRLNGTVDLQGSQLWIEELLSIDDIHGRLGFTHTGISADRLQAQLLDGPATITIRGEGAGETLRTVFNAQGEFEAVALRRLHRSPLLHQIEGRSAWQGTLDVPHGAPQDGARLWLQSELIGVASTLPHPLRKEATERLDAELVHYFSGSRRGHLALALGGDFSLALALDNHFEWLRGAARFGGGSASLPDRDEMYFSGTLRDLDLSRWSAALRGDGVATVAGTAGSDSTWHLPLHVVMDELHLVSPPDDSPRRAPQEAELTQRLPSMQVEVARFGYDAAQMEQLSFRLRSDDESMQVTDLRLTGTALQLSGQGRWQLRPRSYSEMKLQLDSPNFGQMLTALGVASVIADGTAHVTAELNWPAPLQHYDEAILGGDVHVKITDGRMEDVQPGAGRVVGLLSLQGLTRRLLLDFRDLSEKGLVFNTLEGDINLRAGDAYTTNLVMDTTAALLRVEGRTGLVARDFDQRVTVVPNLSGTAPVVGTLAFGPQVGAAMLLFQRLLKSGVDEAASTEYRVTGTWDQPVIEEVHKSKSAPPPLPDHDTP